MWSFGYCILKGHFIDKKELKEICNQLLFDIKKSENYLTEILTILYKENINMNWQLTDEPHECTPTLKQLDQIKMELLGKKNRTPEDQKKLEAVTKQIERYNMFYSQFEE